ncbi:MAG TPA: SGNH/GDSL hydrolase family protein [Candidatus Dormibacteraeota bacterium]
MKAVLAALVFVVACSGSGGTAARPARPAPLVDVRVYVAIGASETLGVGSQEPAAQAWTTVFYRAALPAGALFYNLGEVGATTEQALKDELPVALGLHPDLVTVWLNADDLIHGVSAPDYAAQLDRLLAALAGAGSARLLVANTPVLSDLPAYRACLPDAPPGGPRCAFVAGPVPAPAELDRLVDAYNAQIAAAVSRHGAQLVDLHCQGATAAQHPTWVSGDGFHPTAEGYAQIAQAFAAALRGTSCYRPA